MVQRLILTGLLFAAPALAAAQDEPGEDGRGRPDPLLVANEQCGGAHGRDVHRRVDVRGARGRRGAGDPGRVAADRFRGPAEPVRGHRRIAPARSAQRAAPFLPIRLRRTRHQPRRDRPGRAAAEPRRALPGQQPAAGERRDAGTRSELPAAAADHPRPVARAVGCRRYPRRIGRELRPGRVARRPRGRVRDRRGHVRRARLADDDRHAVHAGARRPPPQDDRRTHAARLASGAQRRSRAGGGGPREPAGLDRRAHRPRVVGHPHRGRFARRRNGQSIEDGRKRRCRRRTNRLGRTGAAGSDHARTPATADAVERGHRPGAAERARASARNGVAHPPAPDRDACRRAGDVHGGPIRIVGQARRHGARRGPLGGDRREPQAAHRAPLVTPAGAPRARRAGLEQKA